MLTRDELKALEPVRPAWITLSCFLAAVVIVGGAVIWRIM
jgi:hypothetical protein